MLKTCQIAVSKPNRNSLWRFGSASFEAQQTAREASGGPMAKQRKAVESCWEGFEGFVGFKGC